MGNEWQVGGQRSLVVVWDAAGASRNVSGDLNDVALSWTREQIALPLFGKMTMPREPGIRDAELEGAAIYSARDTAQDATGIDAVMTGLMSASALTLIDYYPGGSQSGCPYYSGCYLINLWEITGQTQTTVAANWGFDLASGSLTVNAVPVPVTYVPFTVGVTAIGESYIGG